MYFLFLPVCTLIDFCCIVRKSAREDIQSLIHPLISVEIIFEVSSQYPLDVCRVAYHDFVLIGTLLTNKNLDVAHHILKTPKTVLKPETPFLPLVDRHHGHPPAPPSFANATPTTSPASNNTLTDSGASSPALNTTSRLSPFLLTPFISSFFPSNSYPLPNNQEEEEHYYEDETNLHHMKEKREPLETQKEKEEEEEDQYISQTSGAIGTTKDDEHLNILAQRRNARHGNTEKGGGGALQFIGATVPPASLLLPSPSDQQHRKKSPLRNGSV